MSDNKIKVPARGILKISISCSEHPINDFSSKTKVPTIFDLMHKEHLSKKYCRINDARLYSLRNLSYPTIYALLATGRLWNDTHSHYSNVESPKFTEYYGDSLITEAERQRAGADNVAKVNENEPILSGGCCSARAAHKSKYGSKCNVDENNENDEKVDDVELKLNQSLNCGQEICSKCLSHSSTQKIKCGCPNSSCEHNNSFNSKCSCHQFYQSVCNNSTCEDKHVNPCSDNDSSRESEVQNCDALRAGMDPRCKAPPKPPSKSSNNPAKPEGHEFTQHFKYRHVDKDACGTYDIIELDTAENLTKMLAAGAGGGNQLQPPTNNQNDRGGGEVSNDLDHVVHLKNRNVDKSCYGEFDVQEGEQIDVRKIILTGQCMRGGMDKIAVSQSPCAGQKDDDCTKRLISGTDKGRKSISFTWDVQKSYNLDFPSDKVRMDYPHSYSEIDSFSEIDPYPSTFTYRFRAGMDRGNQEFSQKFKYRFADKTVCGTYNIVEMETLEDLNLIAPSRPQQPRQPLQPQYQFPGPGPTLQPHPACERAGLDATCRTRAGQDTPVHSLNNKMKLSEKSEDLISKSTSMKTEHLRAKMNCITPSSFKSNSLDKKQNHLDLLAYNSVENTSLNVLPDINAFGDTKSNCNKAYNSLILSSAQSNKHKNQLQFFDFPIEKKTCKKSSEVGNLRAGMNFNAGISSTRNADEFSQFSKYRYTDKNPCGTQEQETLTDLSLTHLPQQVNEGPCVPQKSPCTGSFGKEPSNVDYFVHRKYKNVEKSCDDLDVQEGEQRAIRLQSAGCPEASHIQSAFQSRSNCPKMEKTPKCNHINKERLSCATHTSARPQSQLSNISTFPGKTLSHCHGSCSPSCSPSCSSRCHSVISSICNCHHKEKKHCKADLHSTCREAYTNAFYDCSPNDAEIDSSSSEISGLLKQEIRRLRKVNEEALAMISAHRCSTQQNLSKHPLICEGGRTMSHYCRASGSSAGGGKNLHPYIDRLVDDCASDVDDSVRKEIIEGVLDFVRSNSNWLKLNNHEDSGDENSIPPSKAVNFEVSGTFHLPLKDKEGDREQDMTITSMQIMPECVEYMVKASSSPQKKETEESEKPKDEVEE